MLKIPSALQAKLDSGVTTLARCWLIVRNDGVTQGFTDHDEDIVLNGVTCRANAGLTASEARTQLGLAVTGTELSGALADDTLTEADLAAGRYDAAAVEVWLVDWSEPSLKVKLRAGVLGEVRREGTAFTAELRGLAHRFAETCGRLYTKTCNADLGDARCTVNLATAAMRGEGTIGGLRGVSAFRALGLDDYADGWFTAGKRTTAEGGDGNLRCKMSKESSAKTLSLLLQTAYSGRAELGLTGDDDFHIKVSADGSTWLDALSIDRANGGLRFLANSTDVASATTCDIGAAPSLKVRVTGTTTISSFGSTIHAVRLVRFADALTLTYNSTSLVLPTGADIVTAANDTAIAVSDATGNWRVWHYQRASGMPLQGGMRTYSFMLADQAAVTIPLPPGAQAMTVMLTNNSSAPTRPNGAVFARCASGPSCIKIGFDPAATSVDVTTGALTGTTGTSGHFTIAAHSDGNLYLENRTGQTRLIGAAILSFA